MLPSELDSGQWDVNGNDMYSPWFVFADTKLKNILIADSHLLCGYKRGEVTGFNKIFFGESCLLSIFSGENRRVWIASFTTF